MAPRKVLLVLFPGFNTLDVNGPYEVLSSPGRCAYFKVTTASETDITVSAEGMQVKRGVALDNSLIETLSDYDILVVPGGPPQKVQATYSNRDGPLLKLIKSYSELKSKASDDKPRTLLSVCTGALFLGITGVFNGRHCTTHWASYDALKEIVHAAASDAGTEKAVVLATRYVDSGINESGVRIVSSGGVSCGMDAALYLVKLYVSEEMAQTTAGTLDYAWRKTEGVVIL